MSGVQLWLGEGRGEGGGVAATRADLRGGVARRAAMRADLRGGGAQQSSREVPGSDQGPMSPIWVRKGRPDLQRVRQWTTR